jgi:phage-related protein
MNDIIAKDTQNQYIDSGFVTLYEITLQGSGTTFYFHAEDQEDTIGFDGNTYQAFPMLLEGVESNSDGAQNRPTLTLANVFSLINNSPASPFLETAQTIATELSPDHKNVDITLSNSNLTFRTNSGAPWKTVRNSNSGRQGGKYCFEATAIRTGGDWEVQVGACSSNFDTTNDNVLCGISGTGTSASESYGIRSDGFKDHNNVSTDVSIVWDEAATPSIIMFCVNMEDDEISVVYDGSETLLFSGILNQTYYPAAAGRDNASELTFNFGPASTFSNTPPEGFKAWNYAGEATFDYEDLVGARVVRRKTLEKHLANGYEFPKASYVVDRIASRDNTTIQLELASPYDLAGIRLPSRNVIGKYCPWVYKGHSQFPTKSACDWKDSDQIEDDLGSTYSFFFNENNEPIIDAAIDQESSPIYKGTWADSPTSYNINEFVTHSGVIYRSQSDANQGNTPSSSSIYWQLCRTYETWVEGASYTIDTANKLANSYVIHEGTVYRCLVAHEALLEYRPDLNTKFWTKADVCGKLLGSCKVRFQAQPISDTALTLPASQMDTEAVLPFGGFPGSRKFR